MTHTDRAAASHKETVSVINADGAADLVLVCEHASNFIPAEYANLGLNAQIRGSHIAWDPGAYGVAKTLSDLLDAPLVAQNVSRLVYDCNRPPDAETAMPTISEIYRVPGNDNLDASAREKRVRTFYRPFHDALEKLIGRRWDAGRPPAIVTIHSFNPIFLGQPRKFDLGILHDADSRLADTLLTRLQSDARYDARRNMPYGPQDGVTHTLLVHALPRLLLNVMIEIRNDLIPTRSEQSKLAHWLAPFLDISVRSAPVANMAPAGGRTVA